ncbi:MAG: hypothetical protein JWL84_3489 [Rhodospirillales bacterium]|nr:hypothetical protein [Rhodospirillales bacterium]
MGRVTGLEPATSRITIWRTTPIEGLKGVTRRRSEVVDIHAYR